jgi:hypothetical protein
MAKKTRRARSQTPRLPDEKMPAASAQVAAIAQRGEQPAAAPPPKKQIDFSTEYRYVLGDLRKMGVIAAAMFAILIVLSLIIR